MKKICVVLIGLLLFAALAGCADSRPSNGGGDGKLITVRFWHGFTGADGDGMKKIVDEFNALEENRGKIKVTVDKLPWDTLFTKLLASKNNPRVSPHIVAMGANRMGGMIAKDILLPMDDIEEYLNVTPEQYNAAAYAVGDMLGHRYSFPLDIHPTAMYYNKDLISQEELPTTWEEFREVCKKKTSGNVYGWVIPSMYSITKDVFYSMLLQNGGALLDADNQPVFDSRAGVDALQYMKDLVSEGISPADVGAGGDASLFKLNRSVFYFDGPWVINSMKEAGVNFGVAPMPGSTGENGTSFAGSHQFTLLKSTVTDDAVRKAAYRFIEFCSKNSLEWAKAGQVPARLDAYETPEFLALTELQAFKDTAANVRLGNCDYRYFYEAYNKMGTAVSSGISGKNAQEALSVAVSEFKQFVAEEEL